MITFMTIFIALLVITYNIRIIHRKQGNNSKYPFFQKNIIINLLLILAGFYFIAMALDLEKLLRSLIFLIGLLFLINGTLEIKAAIRRERNGAWVFTLLINFVFALIEIVLGFVFIVLTIAITV